MPKTVNLASKIEERLPTELVSLMRAIGVIANHQGQHLYLVGGIVRDLLLERETFDLDLVVEGDAVGLAQQLAGIAQGKLTTHPRFKTANLRWNEWSIDLATSRSETYERPGALPSVKPSSLTDDLFRRDFTVNAMAIRLNPGGYGDLVDHYGGRADLDRSLIRILHENSFVDDATRIWRALRYEQRLDFRLESETLRLLSRDIAMLDTISGDRTRHELELVLKEVYPEKVFLRADGLKVLPRLQPGLKGDGWLSGRFEQVRQMSSPGLPPPGLYLALMAYPLTGEQTEQMISRLRLPKSLAQTLRDTCSLKARLKSLAVPNLRPSRIYATLHGYLPAAITAASLATDSPVVGQNMRLYLDRLRYVRPTLTGDDLKAMGVVPGPQISELLGLLRAARLDREVSSRTEEENLVREWLQSHT